MADRKSFLSVPSFEEKRQGKRDSEQLSRNLHDNWFVVLGRRLSSIFTGTKIQDITYNNAQVREIPGKYRTSIFDLLSLKRKGMQFFGDRVSQYNSRVFKFTLGKPSIVICDSDAACETVCDASKVFKEPVFGRKRINLFIIGGHLPCIFTNDFAHARRKAFIIALTSRVTRLYLLPTLIENIPLFLKTWNCPDAKNQPVLIEEEIMKLICSIYCEAFFGVNLEHKHVSLWMKHVFKSPKDKTPVIAAYKAMFKAVEECPKLQQILTTGQKFKMRDDEIINEILFAIFFNGVPATAFTLISSIGRLAALDADSKELLMSDSSSQIKDGISLESVARLRNLENFTLEVLRLSPPAPFVFGVSRSEFVAFSHSGNFRINEGDVLVGNLYECNRDAEFFTDPNKFSPARFSEECLKDSMLTFGERYTNEAKSSNRKCPGQDMAMIILKTCLLSLLYCDLKLKDDATYTDKNFERLGMPDEVLILEKFKYIKPEFWKLSEGYMNFSDCPMHTGRLSTIRRSSSSVSTENDLKLP